MAIDQAPAPAAAMSGGGASPSPASGPFARCRRLVFRVRELSVLIVNIVLIAYFAIANPAFLPPGTSRTSPTSSRRSR